jgi:hypothetical protein
MEVRHCCKATQLGITFFLLIFCASARVGRTDAQETVKHSGASPTAPAGWNRINAGPFSILAPLEWQFHQLQGVDSYVGEFDGDGVALMFDFGRYSNGYLKKAEQPEYLVAKESIGGLTAKLVSPRIPGHGITGIYFRKVSGVNGLCIWGKDLTAAQQQLVLKIFETIRFGGAVPPIVIPPPPPPAR